MRMWRIIGLVRLTIQFKARSVRIGQVIDTQSDVPDTLAAKHRF